MALPTNPDAVWSTQDPRNAPVESNRARQFEFAVIVTPLVNTAPGVPPAITAIEVVTQFE